MGQYLYVLFAIACPLMMIFMMRGHGHGHGMHGHRHGRGDAGTPSSSLEELHRQREELDRQIEERESFGEARGDRSPERV